LVRRLVLSIYFLFVALLSFLIYCVVTGQLSLAVITGYAGLVILIPVLYRKRIRLAAAHGIFSNIVITYSLFAVMGVSLGTVDALVDSWRAKAFIWLAFVTILMVYIDIATLPLYLVVSGIVGMYGGFWSVTWAILWKMTGHIIDYNIWVMPGTWLPEVVYWPIVFSSIAIYFIALIYSYRRKEVVTEKRSERCKNIHLKTLA